MTTKSKQDDDKLLFDDAIGVWLDLERALEGKNGYGGTVAEIYAYRLVPPHLRQRNDLAEAEEQAPMAARNLTRLLRHFVDLHEGVEIGIEVEPRQFRRLDPRVEDIQPFAHRLHLCVDRVPLIHRKLANDLLALWNHVHDLDVSLPQPHFTAWDGATKDLLLALGMEWDSNREAYVFRPARAKP